MAVLQHLTLPVNESLEADFAALLEKSFNVEVRMGALSMGSILRVDKESLLVDIDGKYEGVVPMKEIPNAHTSEDLAEQYQVGDHLEFFVLRDNEEHHQYVLSLRRVQQVKSWETLSEAKEAQTTMQATILGVTKGGILASVMNIKGFIPASQLRVTKSLDDLSGEELPVKVLEVDSNRNKLILSHRQAVFEMKAAMRADTLKQLEEGTIVTGEVVKITDFGVFVDINGIDGLLPLSEITWRRIKHPGDVIRLGEQVTVQVLTVDHERQRISLSLKRMEADPWTVVDEMFQAGQEVEGRISKQLASGVLAELASGVEAYCAYGQHGRVFEQDATYTFEIVSIASYDRRITLAYKAYSVEE
ncbi:MAG: 30S ribosomal protein S1 [Vampirovibrio sp.]